MKRYEYFISYYMSYSKGYAGFGNTTIVLDRTIDNNEVVRHIEKSIVKNIDENNEKNAAENTENGGKLGSARVCIINFQLIKEEEVQKENIN